MGAQVAERADYVSFLIPSEAWENKFTRDWGDGSTEELTTRVW